MTDKYQSWLLGFLSVIGLLASFSFNAILIFLRGAGDEVDAYVAAFTVPQFLNIVFATGFFGALVPHYANKTISYQTAHARKLAGWALSCSLMLSLTLFLASDRWVGFFFYEIYSRQPDLILRLSVDFLVVLPAWALLLIATSVLYARNRFIAVAALTALPLLAAALMLPVFLRYLDFAWVVFLQIAVAYIQLAIAWRLAFSGVPVVQIENIDRRLIKNFFGVSVGNAYLKSDVIFDRYLVSAGSSGDMAVFFLAKQVADACSGLIGKVFINIHLPRLSNIFASGGASNLIGAYNNLLRRMLPPLLYSFVSILALCYFYPVVAVDYFEGAMWVDQFMIVFLFLYGVVFFGATGALVANVFYSANNTRVPTIISALSLSLALFIKYFAYIRWGVVGLALATSIYYFVNFALMHSVLKKNLGVQV